MISFKPGEKFPDIQVKTRDGEDVSLIPKVTEVTSEEQRSRWYAIFIYRGRHCPICAKYLNKLQENLADFEQINTQVVALSADSVEQLNAFYEEKINDVTFPVFARLSKDLMKSMELYTTEPMSSNETDHIFSEPALFVVNQHRQIQIVEKANAPFVRPEIDQLVSGIKFIQENDYPIRGQHSQ